MNLNDQPSASALMPVMREAMRRAGIAAATAAMGVGTASAQMTPTQPVPAPTVPVAPVAQAASPNEAIFKRVDTDGDGFISKSELDKADANLAKDFDRFDIDKDGKLSMIEFDAMMKSMRGG